MIIVKIKGGLGNQMFQYAFAKAVATRANTGLKIDTSYYNKKEVLAVHKDTPREFLLDKFNADISLCSEAEAAKANPQWLQIYKKLRRKIIGRNLTYVYDEKQLALGENAYIDGDWQSEKYFLDIADGLRKGFTLKNPLRQAAQDVVNMIKQVNASGSGSHDNVSVSLHIRRTDITDPKSNYFGICDIAYYKKAYGKIRELTGKKDSQLSVFVFSDDIAWAKENLSLPCAVHFVSRPEIADYEELAIMSNCRHHIIANSSFSWWGAWLGSAEDKTVVAPTRWVVNPAIPAPDILPRQWITV